MRRGSRGRHGVGGGNPFKVELAVGEVGERAPSLSHFTLLEGGQEAAQRSRSPWGTWRPVMGASEHPGSQGSSRPSTM